MIPTHGLPEDWHAESALLGLLFSNGGIASSKPGTANPGKRDIIQADQYRRLWAQLHVSALPTPVRVTNDISGRRDSENSI